MVTGTQIGATASTDGLLYSAPQLNAAGDRVVAVTRSSGFSQNVSVVVINANTGAQVGTAVTVAGQPWQTLTSADGSRIALYTPNFSMQGAGVTLVDTATGTQLGNTRCAERQCAQPHADGLQRRRDPAGRKCHGWLHRAQVVLINTATGAPVGPAATLSGTVSEVRFLASHAARAVVTLSNGSVAVLDTSTGALVGSPVALPGGALVSSVTSDGSRATLVTTSGGRFDVTTIDLATGSPVGTITLGQWDYNSKFSTDGSRIAVTSYDSRPTSVRSGSSTSPRGCRSAASSP